jgi:hypothetical protein
MAVWTTSRHALTPLLIHESFELVRVKSFQSIWRSGELTKWLREDQVWDFRDESQYEALVSETFPIRQANIIGVRTDGTTRVARPVERTRITEVKQLLEASENFDHFVMEHL